jgi:4,4'-diaponeurosporenoate glycosyltransferase
MTGGLALVAAGWLAAWALLAGVRRLPAGAPARGSVSVIVPARNEAARLPTLLAALALDPPGELIVVDDGSDDGTAELARSAGARVIAVDPPDGWTGKSWACWAGAQVARGDVLVFLDADTVPAPGFVARLAGAAERHGGLVSVQPRHEVEQPYEHLSAVCSVVAVIGTGTGRAEPRWWRRPAAYGPAAGIARSTYLAVGGHAARPSTVVDDLALARTVDSAGRPVDSWAGGGVKYRMYGEGWRGLAEGWTKNLANGAGAAPPVRVALVVLWVAAVLQALILAITVGPVGWFAYAAMVLQAWILLRRVGSFGFVTAVLVPLPALAFTGFFAVSAWRWLMARPGSWRGRALPSRSAR